MSSSGQRSPKMCTFSKIKKVRFTFFSFETQTKSNSWCLTTLTSLQDGTTYYVGEEGKSSELISPPPLTLNTGMVRRSSLSPKRGKGDIPKSPVLCFRKEVAGTTTFRIAEMKNQILAMEEELTAVVKDQAEFNVQMNEAKSKLANATQEVTFEKRKVIQQISQISR